MGYPHTILYYGSYRKYKLKEMYKIPSNCVEMKMVQLEFAQWKLSFMALFFLSVNFQMVLKYKEENMAPLYKTQEAN